MAEHWYMGGTLYSANAWQWQESPHENRLATAANWALMQPGIRRTGKKQHNGYGQPYTIELAGCIDRVSAGEFYAEETIPSLAAACMVSMAGDLSYIKSEV